MNNTPPLRRRNSEGEKHVPHCSLLITHYSLLDKCQDIVDKNMCQDIVDKRMCQASVTEALWWFERFPVHTRGTKYSR